MRCPSCGTENSIEVSLVLAAKPLGTWSLAGAQMKTVAEHTAMAVCAAAGCDFMVSGHLEGADWDDQGRFTRGHFVASRKQPPEASPPGTLSE
jgi:hypothetical protein